MESLEPRIVLSATFPADSPAAEAYPLDVALVQKAIVAGHPNGVPADSPDDRVDPNTTTSEFAGVGSLFMDLGNGTGFICTGTLISSTHVLTAGHCLDIDDDGTPDFAPQNVSFMLNFGSDLSHTHTATALHAHPDFTGFANPSVLDDIAIVELASSAPGGVPIYGINTAPFEFVETITLAGYGTTGDARNGYIPNSASFTVKRSGMNRADVFLTDDEGTSAREGFEFDFDGRGRRTNIFGSNNDPANRTLGNDIETTIGGGDSGGPSFIDDGNGGLLVFGVNTFTGGGGIAAAPFFGSIGGGIVVSTYATWINSIINDANQPPIADAGINQSVTTGELVQLDGSGSSDPNSDPLTYHWTLDVPAGSSAVLSDPNAVDPTFVADVDGPYTANLVVNDGQVNSVSDSAIISADQTTDSVHVGDIDGVTRVRPNGIQWLALIRLRIHDNGESPVAGATVMGQFSGATSEVVSGVTSGGGFVVFRTPVLTGESVTFEVTNVSADDGYDPLDNHDPDGDSDGTSITLLRDDPMRLVATGTQIESPSVMLAREIVAATLAGVDYFATSRDDLVDTTSSLGPVSDAGSESVSRDSQTRPPLQQNVAQIKAADLLFSEYAPVERYQLLQADEFQSLCSDVESLMR